MELCHDIKPVRLLSKEPKIGLTNYRLMQVKSIAECSKGRILQYFRPSLSYRLSLRSLIYLFLSGRFTYLLTSKSKEGASISYCIKFSSLCFQVTMSKRIHIFVPVCLFIGFVCSVSGKSFLIIF